MAGGMVDAVRRISGVGEEVLVPVSNEGKSPETLQAEMEEILRLGPTILFTDLASGSCALTARLCCRDESLRVAVIFGVNLPILLDFVFHRNLPLEEIVPRLLDKGRGSLTSTPEFVSDAHRPLSG
jgi:mannose/fructose-specific phosphotransferase system component IIA